MLLYIKSSKDAKSSKLLELINEFVKVAGYKINTLESTAFLYSNNKRQKENKETISFTSISQTIKYLRLNLPKEAKDLHSRKL